MSAMPMPTQHEKRETTKHWLLNAGEDPDMKATAGKPFVLHTKAPSAPPAEALTNGDPPPLMLWGEE